MPLFVWINMMAHPNASILPSAQYVLWRIMTEDGWLFARGLWPGVPLIQ